LEANSEVASALLRGSSIEAMSARSQGLPADFFEVHTLAVCMHASTRVWESTACLRLQDRRIFPSFTPTKLIFWDLPPHATLQSDGSAIAVLEENTGPDMTITLISQMSAARSELSPPPFPPDPPPSLPSSVAALNYHLSPWRWPCRQETAMRATHHPQRRRLCPQEPSPYRRTDPVPCRQVCVQPHAPNSCSWLPAQHILGGITTKICRWSVLDDSTKIPGYSFLASLFGSCPACFNDLGLGGRGEGGWIHL